MKVALNLNDTSHFAFVTLARCEIKGKEFVKKHFVNYAF